VPAEVRLYDYLFDDPHPGNDGRDLFDDLNPDSETVLRQCLVEPALAGLPPGETVQFERLGYFCLDPDSAPARSVQPHAHLRDTWAKLQAQGRAKHGLTHASGLAPPCRPHIHVPRRLEEGAAAR